MKIVISVCKRINGICSSMGCFRAYNNRNKHFSSYKNIETELIAFFSCNICSSDGLENLEKIAARLKENKVDVVHLGACAVKCKADRLGQIKEVFSSRNITLIEGTH